MASLPPDGRGPRPRPPGRRPGPRPTRPQPPLPPTWEKPERLVIGRVLSAHGVEGAFRMEIQTHFPERLPTLRRVYLGDETRPRRVRAASLHPPHALLHVSGLTSPEEVAPWRGELVRIDHGQAKPLRAGEYYHWQLLGARVVEESGEPLGILAEILETGANDVYVVRTPTGGELLLPAIKDVVRRVDTTTGVVTVHLLPGLRDEPDATDQTPAGEAPAVRPEPPGA